MDSRKRPGSAGRAPADADPDLVREAMTREAMAVWRRFLSKAGKFAAPTPPALERLLAEAERPDTATPAGGPGQRKTSRGGSTES